jgi:hypothetical protein
MDMITKNFKITDVICKCGRCNQVPEISFLNVLQGFREFISRPINVISAKRCESWNKVQGGSDSKTHVEGNAADIYIPGLDLAEMYVLAHNYGKFTHIGIFPWWNIPGLHVDTALLMLGKRSFYSPKLNSQVGLEEWSEYQRIRELLKESAK